MCHIDELMLKRGIPPTKEQIIYKVLNSRLTTLSQIICPGELNVNTIYRNLTRT